MVYSGEMKLSSKDTQDAVDLNYLHVELSIGFFFKYKITEFQWTYKKWEYPKCSWQLPSTPRPNKTPRA